MAGAPSTARGGAVAAVAGALLFLAAGWAVLRHRSALKLAHEDWDGPPALVRAAVAAGAALAAAGAAAVAGSLRPISPAANQNPLAGRPFRPDFLTLHHRGNRPGSGLAAAGIPPIGPIPPGLVALEARWRRGEAGGSARVGGGGARPAESDAATTTTITELE